MARKSSFIYRTNQLIRDVANEITSELSNKEATKNFSEALSKRFKFQDKSDWNVLCSLMGVIKDTELAKDNFMRFGITGPTKIRDNGEYFLRLYGIVNAIYLQRSALEAFLEIFKIKGKKEILATLNKLSINELRNIVGAHTVNYYDNGKKTPHQIGVANMENGIILTSNAKTGQKEFSLDKLIREYDEVFENILIDATKLFIMKVLAVGSKKREKYLNKLESINLERKGHLIIGEEETDDEFKVTHLIKMRTDIKW